MKKHLTAVENYFKDSIETKRATLEGKTLDVIVDMAQEISDAIEMGNMLYLCGNGGSAADAQHLAAELLVRLRAAHNRDAIPALTLATDTSMLTACGNDYSFDDIYSRPLSGLGRKGDVLLGITTSGNSQNVINAMNISKELGMKTFGFLGCEGGRALEHCDLSFVVPSNMTAHIQEVHITAGHILCTLIEDILIEKQHISLK